MVAVGQAALAAGMRSPGGRPDHVRDAARADHAFGTVLNQLGPGGSAPIADPDTRDDASAAGDLPVASAKRGIPPRGKDDRHDGDPDPDPLAALLGSATKPAAPLPPARGSRDDIDPATPGSSGTGDAPADPAAGLTAPIGAPVAAPAATGCGPGPGAAAPAAQAAIAPPAGPAPSTKPAPRPNASSLPPAGLPSPAADPGSAGEATGSASVRAAGAPTSDAASAAPASATAPALPPSVTDQVTGALRSLGLGASHATPPAPPVPATQPGMRDDAPAAGPAAGLRSLTVNLTPDHLGPVSITMRMTGDGVDIRIAVASHDALQQLERDRHAITAVVEAAGLKGDRVTLAGVTPSAARDAAPGLPSHTPRNDQGGFASPESAGGDRSRQGARPADPSRPKTQTDDEISPPAPTRRSASDGSLYI